MHIAGPPGSEIGVKQHSCNAATKLPQLQAKTEQQPCSLPSAAASNCCLQHASMFGPNHDKSGTAVFIGALLLLFNRGSHASSPVQ